MKKLTLIYEKLFNFHLLKDVGQIPYLLQKYYGFESEIVCYKNDKEYKYLDSEVKGLKLTFLNTNIYSYLFKNAKKIDLLMLFHISTRSIYAGLFYKLLKPNGYLYVKADIGTEKILYSEWGTRNFITQSKRIFLFNQFIKKVNLVSFECFKTYKSVDNIPESKKIHVPNGFDTDLIKFYGIKIKTFEKKENIILLVGRHGTKEKNTELFLNALEKIKDIKDWKVFFIGSMTNEFKKHKDEFFKKNPYYKDKLFFTENVDDKRILFEYYNRAKILCLPSRTESWGIVCVEALAFGNVLIMNKKLLSSYDLTKNGEVGLLIENENSDDLARVLTSVMNNQEILRDLSFKAVEHFKYNFEWENILKKLVERICHKSVIFNQE